MRTCIGCGGNFDADDLLAGYCPRCDKIVADTMAGLKAKLEVEL